MDVGNYVSRKNNNLTVKVVEVDEKTKTLIYEGADGKTHSVSWSSFRKSYKEEVKEEAKSNALVIESKIDSEPKPDKEPAEDSKNNKQEKPKKERKPRKSKPKNDENVALIVDKAQSIVKGLGGSVKVPRDEAMKFRALCKGERQRQFCKMMWSGKSVKFFTRNNYDKYNPQKINYNLPYVYEFIALTNDDIKAITDILSSAYNDTNTESKTKNKKEEQ